MPTSLTSSERTRQLSNWQTRHRRGGINPFSLQTQGILIGEGSKAQKNQIHFIFVKNQRGTFLVVGLLGHHVRHTVVSNAKRESILGGIHSFENNPQMSINLAHIHLLPALCPSKIIP